jgi:type IV pilus assembly protein PilW
MHGLTLVELMVAMVIGLILILAVSAVYVGSRQTYRSGEGISRLQESARFAFTFLSRDIRQAGYFGCVGGNVTVNNTLNNATTAAFDFQRPLSGYDASVGGSTWSPAIPAGLSGSVVPVSGSDALIVRGLSGPLLPVRSHPGGTPPGSAAILVDADNGLARGDIVLVSDCIAAAIFQISSANPNTSGSLAHNTGTGTPGNATTSLGKEFTDGEVVRVASFLYFVGTNPAGRPALYRREVSRDGAAAEELVEGIENLQITYGVDTDNDRAANSYARADQVEAAGQWDRVVSIRIEMLVQSPEDNIATEAMSYVIGGATTPYVSTDRRLRQVYSTTITLRNRVE